jgi:hypothetical protein
LGTPRADDIPLKHFAIAQAVIRWLPTAATRVRVRVWPCGISRGQSVAGAGFLRVHRFPLPNLSPPVAPQSPSYINWGWYNRPVVAAVPSGLTISLTPLRIIITIIIIHFFIDLYSFPNCFPNIPNHWDLQNS